MKWSKVCITFLAGIEVTSITMRAFYGKTVYPDPMDAFIKAVVWSVLLWGLWKEER